LWVVGAVVAIAAGAWWAGKNFRGEASAQSSTADGGRTPERQVGPQGGPKLASQRGGAGGPGGQGGPGGGAGRPQPVTVGLVRHQDLRVSVHAIGSIAAANTAIVRAKIEGELQAIHFKEGQTVRAGALLAELDPRPLQIAVNQAQGQLTRDQAQLQNARLDLVRFQDLLSRDGISKQQVDTQQALVNQLQGTVQTAQAQLDNARLQLSYTRITAPISGRVGLKRVDVGNVVRPSDVSGVVSVSQTQPADVVFAVPDLHLPLIARQLRASRPLAVEAWDRELKNKLADGRVSSVDNAIDAATGTIKLKAQFRNGDDGLFPNQSVQVRLHLATEEDAVAVPVSAVQRGAQGTYVYVLDENKTARLRPVHTGTSDSEWIGIKGEVKAGDQVVVEGAERLREGSRVEIIAPVAQAALQEDERGKPGVGRRARGGSAVN
jgi:multidrug efflux system membrane fusion protein